MDPLSFHGPKSYACNVLVIYQTTPKDGTEIEWALQAFMDEKFLLGDQISAL